jgi:hypothetical protein
MNEAKERHGTMTRNATKLQAMLVPSLLEQAWCA